jgi:hypothetical protein
MNNTMSKLMALALTGLAMLLGSCTKPDGPISVEGQVVDRLTNKPVAGASVQLRARRGSSQAFGDVGDPQPADAQGRFRLNFAPQPDERYSLMASTELGYYTIYAEAPRLQEGKNKRVRVPMQPPAWVQVRLIDELPLSKVWLYVSGYQGGGEEFVFPQSQSYVRPVSPVMPHRLFWRITDQTGAIRREGKDFTVAPLDTVTIDIKF